MNPTSKPEPEHSTCTALANELSRQALIVHGDSYRGGSRSPFYEACTQQFIVVLAREIVALADPEGRPLNKVLAAADKALSALNTTINGNNEEYK